MGWLAGKGESSVLHPQIGHCLEDEVRVYRASQPCHSVEGLSVVVDETLACGADSEDYADS